jgi:hypothetical protein
VALDRPVVRGYEPPPEERDPKQTLVAVRLAARQARALKARAKREGIGLSEALRRSVDEWASSTSLPRTSEPRPRPLTKDERESFDQVFAAFGLKAQRRSRRRR